jgi:hypothetical protein
LRRKAGRGVPVNIRLERRVGSTGTFWSLPGAPRGDAPQVLILYTSSVSLAFPLRVLVLARSGPQDHLSNAMGDRAVLHRGICDLIWAKRKIEVIV